MRIIDSLLVLFPSAPNVPGVFASARFIEKLTLYARGGSIMQIVRCSTVPVSKRFPFSCFFSLSMIDVVNDVQIIFLVWMKGEQGETIS